MKQRFWLFKRGSVCYLQDSETGKKESLGTRDAQQAERLRAAKNEAAEKPLLGLMLGKPKRCRGIAVREYRLGTTCFDLSANETPGGFAASPDCCWESAGMRAPEAAFVRALFPQWSKALDKDPSAEFRRRCRILKIDGVSLHSYQYSWAERAFTSGYPERFAMANPGHSSRAVHRSYAKAARVICPLLEESESRKNPGLLSD